MSDRVYEEIASAIRNVDLLPGAPISESELSLQLGVSRTPVREALARLADHGLVIVEPQVGTTIALIDMAEVEEAVFVRRALEVAAFTRACELHAEVSGLRTILLRQESALATHDEDAYFLADEALHEEIFALSGYPHVWKVVRRSKMQLDRLRRLFLTEVLANQRLTDEHVRIVDLLEVGDVEAGTGLINEHSTRVLDFAPSVRDAHPTFFTT
ncbi:MAG: GntR family transcriptional regulator, rspAB operon transcriptional repressor [Actinomycetota bacterium]|jgi:DNA-binding GntR family transcriptional regulator|nr:GntR family transcriptional regulator, rspAB operon transcriptional repressor [Actinomycetota bacterium]